MKELNINGVNLLIINDEDVIEFDVRDREIMSLGIDKSGHERFAYILCKTPDNFMSIIGIDPYRVDGGSPMECWRENDWCFYNYNNDRCGEPLYRSEIDKMFVEKLRDMLYFDHN